MLFYVPLACLNLLPFLQAVNEKKGQVKALLIPLHLPWS